LPKYVALRFLLWMPCLKHFPPRADSPQWIYLFIPQNEPRMDSRTISVLFLGTCDVLFEKNTQSFIILKARHRILPKFKLIYQTVSQFNILQALSTTNVPNIHRSSLEYIQSLCFTVSAHTEHKGKISLELLLYSDTG
jgi:hypothetical protein